MYIGAHPAVKSTSYKLLTSRQKNTEKNKKMLI